MSAITKRQAEATLARVKKQFSVWLSDGQDEPLLVKGWDSPNVWSILWDGGPFEWTMFFPHGGIEEEFGFNIKATDTIKGVFAEPYSYTVLNLYKEG